MRYLVTRHVAARQWLAERGTRVDQTLDHLDPQILRAGDTVIGTLPLHLAAEVCARGARYMHICLDPAFEDRGRELTLAEMRTCGARLEEFVVRRAEGPRQ